MGGSGGAVDVNPLDLRFKGFRVDCPDRQVVGKQAQAELIFEDRFLLGIGGDDLVVTGRVCRRGAIFEPEVRCIGWEVEFSASSSPSSSLCTFFYSERSVGDAFTIWVREDGLVEDFECGDKEERGEWVALPDPSSEWEGL